MNDLTYEIILYWDKQDSIFVAEVPELPGCMAHGKTQSEAISEAEAAITLWVNTASEEGLSIPAPKGKLSYA